MAKLVYRTHEEPCKICGTIFKFSHATGRHKTICSDQCRSIAVLDGTKKRLRLICDVDGCSKPARPGRLLICSMHYHRRYRTGTTHKDQPAYRGVSTGGYVYVYASHPMTRPNGIAYEHRVIAFDHHGEGPHPCYWCGKTIEWSKICVDHLNERKNDNRIENLVLACNGCNRMRSYSLSFIRRILPERVEDLMRMVFAASLRE